MSESGTPEAILSAEVIGDGFGIALHAAMTAAAAERDLTLNAFVVRLCAEGMQRLIPARDIRLTHAEARDEE